MVMSKGVFILGIHKLCLSSFPFHCDSMTTNPVLELEKMIVGGRRGGGGVAQDL